MKKCITLVTILIGGSLADGAFIASTFDSGLDGWTSVPGETTSITWRPTGGNPDGYVLNLDMGSTGGNIVAPPGFLGNWSLIEGFGELRWDFNMFDPGGGTVVPLTATIFGPGGTATFDSGIYAPANVWMTVMAPIQESSWTITSGDWTDLISSVTEVHLMIENVISSGPGPWEMTGIDNVFLTRLPTIPAPGALLLTGVGMGLVGWLRRRRAI